MGRWWESISPSLPLSWDKFEVDSSLHPNQDGSQGKKHVKHNLKRWHIEMSVTQRSIFKQRMSLVISKLHSVSMVEPRQPKHFSASCGRILGRCTKIKNAPKPLSLWFWHHLFLKLAIYSAPNLYLELDLVFISFLFFFLKLSQTNLDLGCQQLS